MSRKKKGLLIGASCVLFVVVGLGVAFLLGNEMIANLFGFAGRTGECTLYWNVEKEVYSNDAGVSTRKPAADGYYKVLLAVDGEQVEYSVSDKTLVDEIDSRDLMGLEVDRKGIITDVFAPDEVCDGEMISKWYIVSHDAGVYKVGETIEGEGVTYQVKTSKQTGIYDVTGPDKIGHSTSLEIGDCVRVFRNYDKEVIYIFVVRGEDYYDGNIVTKYCSHCDKEVAWKEWTQIDKAPSEDGHWLLANDITLSYHATVSKDNNVVVDLNGKTIEAVSNRRVYYVGDKTSKGTLAILDQSESQAGTLKASGYTKNGGVVYVRTGLFELYSGTIDASQVDSHNYGQAICMYNKSTVNMYGGTIIGGTSRAGGRAGNSSYIGGAGGSLHILNGATFTMYDGIIRDGKAYTCADDSGKHNGIGGNLNIRTGATFIMEGGKILNGSADKTGGNIYVASNATVIMRGGEISGGTCQVSGGSAGNIYIAEGSMYELHDGAIKDGSVMEGYGGNVVVRGILVMRGGSITGGSSVEGETFEKAVKREGVTHHNVYCNNIGTFDMSGGYIDGYVRIHKTTCITKISGTAQITGGKTNLSIVTKGRVQIDNLSKGARIGISGVGYVSEETASRNLSYVYSDYEKVPITYQAKKFFIGKMSCVCGGHYVNSAGTVVTGHYGACDGKVVEWWPWVDKESAPTTEGNWYLIEDVKLIAQKSVAREVTMALDLNGHTIYGCEHKRIYNIGDDRKINMTITDLSEKKNGRLVSTGEGAVPGSCLFINKSNKVVMYGGVLDGTAFTSTKSGATLAIRKEGTFVMYGGSIVGGTAQKCNGGSAIVEGKMLLQGGVIRDGKSNQYGGNIYVKEGTLTIRDDAVVRGGTAPDAGNIILSADSNLYIEGGVVTDGIAERRGGNIYTKSPIRILGGTISNGVAGDHGGNIYTSSDITMTGGIISGGTALYDEDKSDDKVTTNAGNEHGLGGNIFAVGAKNKSITVKITKGTVTGGVANGRGGNINLNYYADLSLGVNDTNAEPESAVISGGTIDEKLNNGKNSINGGNIFAQKSSCIYIKNGASVKDGAASGWGGNISFNGATFNQSGGVIQNGIAKCGGNIHIGEKGTVNLSGGSICDGTTANSSSTKGGNIYNQGSLTVKGKAILSGGAAIYGGNIYNEKNFNIQETATITGGTAEDHGGNIYTVSNITMNGGSIIDGTAIYDEDKTDDEVKINAGNDHGLGGNIFALGTDEERVTVTITGGTVTAGVANGRGGNINLNGYADLSLGVDDTNAQNDLVVISGGDIDDSRNKGNNSVNGGNIFAQRTSAITMKLGVTIKDGKVSGWGGNISFNGSTFNQSGGTIQNGTAKCGGNIHVGTKGEVVLSGGTVKDGITANSTSTKGGNIYNQGSLTVKGNAVVSGGTAIYGGNIYTEGTTKVEGATAGEDFTAEGLKTILSGKNVSILGDSISTYEGVSNGDIADETNSTIKNNKNYYTAELLASWKETYWGRLIDEYKMNLLVNNSAHGAYVMTDRSDTQLSGITRCTELHDNTGDNAETEPDIITVYMGTNDLIKGSDLGELTDATYSAVKNPNGEYITPTTFTEGYIVLLDKIVNRYKNADVFCFTLLPTSNIHKDQAKIALLSDYNARIREIAKHYNVTLVDIATESGITLNNYTQLQNGSHPLSVGMGWIANVFEKALGTKYGVEVSQDVATICGGSAEKQGGNIYVGAKGELTINGGVIRDGLAITATENEGVGGNIYADGTKKGDQAVVTINKGTIIDGKATYRGGNIMLSYGPMNLGEGRIVIVGGRKVKVSGDVVEDYQGQNVFVLGDATNKINITKALHKDTLMGIVMSKPLGVFAKNAGDISGDFSANFFADVHEGVSFSDGKLSLISN